MNGSGSWARSGLITFFLGAFLAMFQQDLKGLLAYSTISHLGLITLADRTQHPARAVAAIFHIMNHATFKASLFMAAGIIDHETGTRDIRRLSGLWAFMPITATLAMVAAAAMAGVPLLNGFLSKEMFFAETIEVHDNSARRSGAAVHRHARQHVHGCLFAALHPRRVLRPGSDRPAARSARAAPADALPGRTARAGMPRRRRRAGLTVAPILDTAARAVLGPAMPEYSLRLWHGLRLNF